MLTDTAIKAIRTPNKATKHFDGGGLYLLATPQGSKLWRLKYRLNGRERLMSLGAYPAIALREARELRDDTRRLIARGVDPVATRRKQHEETANTFRALADEYMAMRNTRLAAITLRKARWQLDEFILPAFGDRPIASIKASDVLAMLRKIERKGHLETARKSKELCGRIFRFAVATDRAERDPTGDLRGALKPPTVRNHAAITEPKKVGELLRAIDGYTGQPSTAFALKLAPHVFLRPGELRAARWSEIDLCAALWRVPGERTKMRREHLVPLSKQVIELLRELQALTGHGDWLFPAIGPANRCISENTINGALRRLGYSNKDMVAHGFRAMASTLLNELGHPPDVIELQLAHKDKDAVRAVYNRATRLAERKKMMQQWSDYLDRLKASAVILPFSSHA